MHVQEKAICIILEIINYLNTFEIVYLLQEDAN